MYDLKKEEVSYNLLKYVIIEVKLLYFHRVFSSCFFVLKEILNKYHDNRRTIQLTMKN